MDNLEAFDATGRYAQGRSWSAVLTRQFGHWVRTRAETGGGCPFRCGCATVDAFAGKIDGGWRVRVGGIRAPSRISCGATHEAPAPVTGRATVYYSA